MDRLNKITRLGMTKKILFMVLTFICFHAMGLEIDSHIPKWIHSIQANYQAKTPKEFYGSYFDLVKDSQISLQAKNQAHVFIHNTFRIENINALQRSPSFSYEYRKGRDRLIFHSFKIIRGNQVIDKLKSDENAYQEYDAEPSIYMGNGHKVVRFIIADLRVGDVVEVKYSTIEDLSLFNGHFSRFIPLFNKNFVNKYYYRITGKKGLKRKILNENKSTFKLSFKNDEIILSGESVFPLAIFETNLPAGHILYPFLQVSDRNSWAGIINIMDSFFSKPTISQELKKEIDKLSKIKNKRQKLEETIRFVQNEVRYYARNEGVHSHRPHDPSDILKKRFGDCKDKSFLLVTMLKHLGYEAYPFLVDTGLKKSIKNLLPSPYIFDHVICNLKFEGKDYFIDATQSNISEGLNYPNPDYRYGLRIAPETNELTEIPFTISKKYLEEFHEIFTYNPEDQSFTLKRTVYKRGYLADSLRYQLEVGGSEEYDRNITDSLRDSYKSAHPIGTLTITDDKKNNQIIYNHMYKIFPHIEQDSFKFGFWSINMSLPQGIDEMSKNPLFVNYNTHVYHSIEIKGLDVNLKNHKNFIITSEEFKFAHNFSNDSKNKTFKGYQTFQTFGTESFDRGIYVLNVKKIKEHNHIFAPKK